MEGRESRRLGSRLDEICAAAREARQGRRGREATRRRRDAALSLTWPTTKRRAAAGRASCQLAAQRSGGLHRTLGGIKVAPICCPRATALPRREGEVGATTSARATAAAPTVLSPEARDELHHGSRAPTPH